MNTIRNAYELYTTADFLQDQEFLSWVKYPTEEWNAYWSAISVKHQKGSEMQQAREMILLLNSTSQPAVEDRRDIVWEKIAGTMKKPVVRKISPWRGIAAAASVLLVISAGFFIYRQSQLKRSTPKVAAIVNDVAPGRNVAMLTLANGQKVMLDSSTDGLLAREGGTNIRKTAGGQIVYEDGAATENELTVRINRIDIPRGGQYQLVLPDGTKVWLNAASSLQYPSSFTGKDRTVHLSGEAYFEVAQNTEMPFRVVSANQTLEVLGTHFNINSYDEEDVVKTTLLQGSVKLTNTLADASRILRPGEQSALYRAKQSFRVAKADIEETMAWKEGYFIWNKEPLESIMRKLARWYNIEPVYEKPLTDVELSGIVSRSKNLSEVLAVMEMTGSVHFRIDGKKLIVTR